MYGTKATTTRRTVATAVAALALAGGTALGAANTATAATTHATPHIASAQASMPAGGLTAGQLADGAHTELLRGATSAVTPSAVLQGVVVIDSLYTVTHGQCLDADATNGGNGTRVQAWACNGSTQQEWYSYSDGSLESVRFPGMCLDADTNGAGNNGTKVQLWQCNGSTQQDWFFRSGDLAMYNLRFNNNLNTVLDRNATIPGNGAPAQLWQKNFQSQQWWKPVLA
ncbi:RICIN domain-containing protein [Streptacidiphilus rugosus]|uniref:RICIN domain-containing protein n=1 Tax=Streptacidiphilus rugosus TaxID=405783 RepID=UPI000564621E|nr:RICIN domain-containing protein [Streptacidiphilus rugosus]